MASLVPEGGVRALSRAGQMRIYSPIREPFPGGKATYCWRRPTNSTAFQRGGTTVVLLL